MAGAEYDKQGVDIARQDFPDVHFYNLGVQDDPSIVLAAEGDAFDAVDSGEDDPRSVAIKESGFKPNPQTRSHAILNSLLNGR